MLSIYQSLELACFRIHPTSSAGLLNIAPFSQISHYWSTLSIHPTFSPACSTFLHPSNRFYNPTWYCSIHPIFAPPCVMSPIHSYLPTFSNIYSSIQSFFFTQFDIPLFIHSSLLLDIPISTFLHPDNPGLISLHPSNLLPNMFNIRRSILRSIHSSTNLLFIIKLFFLECLMFSIHPTFFQALWYICLSNLLYWFPIYGPSVYYTDQLNICPSICPPLQNMFISIHQTSPCNLLSVSPSSWPLILTSFDTLSSTQPPNFGCWITFCDHTVYIKRFF